MFKHVLQQRFKIFKVIHHEINRKMGGCYSWQILRQNVSWFLLKHKKTLNRRVFILKPSERT